MLLSGSINIAQILGMALVLLVAMTVHEWAHNYVGWRMGDPVPAQTGRLTLNPLVHIYWPGWLMWVLVGFGILGSAPISEYRMRDRRWGYLAAVAAGPVSNLVLAVIVAVLYRLNLWEVDFARRGDILPSFNVIMTLMFQFNVLLFIFNLIPLFPFDGWHILRKLLPPSQAAVLERYQNETMYIFLFLIALSFLNINVIGQIITPPMNFLFQVLLGI
ncbi:MAG: site-2 protease family protein [Anaerolineae bacterium]|nr:site-2 protease family protein [Anaerolineae bacterium]